MNLKLFDWISVDLMYVLCRAMVKNGSSRCFFGQKRVVYLKTIAAESVVGRMNDQHPLSPIFGQTRRGAPGNSYFGQLPPVFGHFMFLSGGLLDYSNRSTRATRKANLHKNPVAT